MTVYIVQIEDWGWENNGVFANKEDAKKDILTQFVDHFPEECEKDENEMLTPPQDIIDELNENDYITDFAAIETWEVE